jgi:hypothetical protein
MANTTVSGLLAALALVAAGAAAAAGTHVTGLVTQLNGGTLQILTTARDTATVALDDHTGYTKWITHKPRQQDSRATAKSVAPGRCVDVEFRANGTRVAKVVRISVDDAGTLDDPCKAIR